MTENNRNSMCSLSSWGSTTDLSPLSAHTEKYRNFRNSSPIFPSYRRTHDTDSEDFALTVRKKRKWSRRCRDAQLLILKKKLTRLTYDERALWWQVRSRARRFGFCYVAKSAISSFKSLCRASLSSSYPGSRSGSTWIRRRLASP